MHSKMHDITTVIAGYTFRTAINHDPKGVVAVIQAKDLVQGQYFEFTGNLARVSDEQPGDKALLRKDDVLLVARGMKAGAFRSTVFMADDHDVIASSSVHIIRVTSANVLPEYISLYLNSREGQAALANIVTGSYIGAIPRSKLGELVIPIPKLQKQHALVELSRNIQEQQKLLDREKEIKQSIISAAIHATTV